LLSLVSTPAQPMLCPRHCGRRCGIPLYHHSAFEPVIWVSTHLAETYLNVHFGAPNTCVHQECSNSIRICLLVLARPISNTPARDRNPSPGDMLAPAYSFLDRDCCSWCAPRRGRKSRSSNQAPVYPLKCQVFVREDLERRVTTWAITAFISENPSMRAHCLTH
jgi:hypothetical protein